jgi:hypothetical protein
MADSLVETYFAKGTFDQEQIVLIIFNVPDFPHSFVEPATGSEHTSSGPKMKLFSSLSICAASCSGKVEEIFD